MVKNDQIIADFMGYHSTLTLSYSKSWDLIMPVVRKCVTTAINDKEILESEQYTSLLETIPLAILSDVYKVVIEFINFVNEKRENSKKDFKEYKLIHKFMHPDEPLKEWFDDNNYTNIYREDWNALHDVLAQCKGCCETISSDPKKYNHVEFKIFRYDYMFDEFMYGDMEAIYERVHNFIRYWNKEIINKNETDKS